MRKVRLQNELISPELKRRFKEIGWQDTPDPIVIAKFFNPSGWGTWYATAYNEDNNTCYGYVADLVPGFDEWGYFSIDELESFRDHFYSLPIERDLYFDEVRFSELKM